MTKNDRVRVALQSLDAVTERFALHGAGGALQPSWDDDGCQGGRSRSDQAAANDRRVGVCAGDGAKFEEDARPTSLICNTEPPSRCIADANDVLVRVDGS